VGLGFSQSAIDRGLAAGRLHRIQPGVYAVGHPKLPRYGPYMAALLACGDGAVLSRRAAAALIGHLPAPSGEIDVTIKDGRTRKRPGIAIHTTRWLPTEEITNREGMPCTSVARTLVDLSNGSTERQLRRAFQQSSYLRLFDRRALDRVLAHSHGVHGIATVRRILEELGADDDIPLTELERRFLALVRAAGLPDPVPQGFVAGWRVDFHWPAQRLVVETDGREAHAHEVAFATDRQRDFELELAGWHVLRISWRQVIEQPEQVVQLLRYSIASIGSEKSISASSVAINRP
jgi:very-short-patch-repair endonuclease